MSKKIAKKPASLEVVYLGKALSLYSMQPLISSAATEQNENRSNRQQGSIHMLWNPPRSEQNPAASRFGWNKRKKLKTQAMQFVVRRRKETRQMKKRGKLTPSYGRMGSLEVRLASGKKEVKKAQRLRYKVFYKEMSAIPDAKTKLKRRDIDQYDAICDHLLVLDHNVPSRKFPFAPKTKIVGTYRILTDEKAKANGGFYTQSEYNIAPLIEGKAQSHKFMELGRSCVLKSHRTKRSVELLWQGLWAYICQQQADVIIGCASFPGTNPQDHALALSFLHHQAKAPEEWRVKAHDHHYVDMNMIPKAEIDPKKALKALPPLIKGYLRVGAYVGDGAVVDHQFGTTDIFIILPVNAIDPRYRNHFGDRKVSKITTRERLNLTPLIVQKPSLSLH